MRGDVQINLPNCTEYQMYDVVGHPCDSFDPFCVVRLIGFIRLVRLIRLICLDPSGPFDAMSDPFDPFDMCGSVWYNVWSFWSV